MVSRGSLTGERFGNYIAHRVLGRGGMGTVYLAEHPEIGRQVAIKVVASHDDEELIQRFLAEAKAVNRIGHPNIIDIYDFGRTPSGRLYYVMEYLEGRELGRVMSAKKRMSAEEVLPYLSQLCAAMQAAHEAGIVHRDLKPANIFILDGEEVRVKVLDFGVAKLLDRPPVGYTTTPGALIGTPMFGAPEQLTAQADKICPQTDLYSLGVITFWMLTGRPPYMADNNAVLMTMHVEDPIPSIRRRVPEVPEAAATLIEGCLAKRPEHRPCSAGVLAAAFRQAIVGMAEGETPVDAFAPTAKAPTDDVAVADLSNLSTLVEVAAPSFGDVDGAKKPEASRAEQALAPRETLPAWGASGPPQGSAPETSEVGAPESAFRTSATVEVVQQAALAVEPPNDAAERRGKRPTRPITGPQHLGSEELVDQTIEDERALKPTEQMPTVEADGAEQGSADPGASDWGRPAPSLHRSGRLPTMQRKASPPKQTPGPEEAASSEDSGHEAPIEAPAAPAVAEPAPPAPPEDKTAQLDHRTPPRRGSVLWPLLIAALLVALVVSLALR